MWIYQRAVSLSSNKITLVRRGYTFMINKAGELLSSPITDEMLAILKADPAWTFVGEQKPDEGGCIILEENLEAWLRDATDNTPEDATDSTDEDATDSSDAEPTDSTDEDATDSTPEDATDSTPEDATDSTPEAAPDEPKRRRGRPRKSSN